MITVVAKNYAKKDKIEEFKKIAQKLEQLTNQNDAGCISYKLYQDINDPTVFVFIEEWEDMKSLQNHTNAEHFTTLVSQMQPLCDRPGEANFLQRD